jgi:hypothetical protein
MAAGDLVTAPPRRAVPPHAVHVVVTCTNRKTLPVPPRLRLDSVRACSTAQRARQWAGRLAGSASVPLLAAQDLYAGEHWMIARSLPRLACDARIQLWVCSAGYGLIPADALIRPYAATFSGRPDLVPGGGDGARRWWDAMAGWEGPAPGRPRSINALTAADPSACFVLALSASYLDACRDDIAAAAGQVTDPDSLMVVSAGARFAGSVAAVMVPADARLQALLGGTRQALNARIAADLLAAGITSRAEAVRRMTRLLAGQPPVARYQRRKLSDKEVTGMIACRLAQAPGVSASRLLREFRDDGYACEQSRFAGLHRLVTGARP